MKVKVSAKAEKFRRAGFAFTREPVEIEVDEKTIEVLNSEPMLAVEVLKEEDDEKKGKGPGKKSASDK